MLSQIDLIIECRDYRVPLTSHNPLFEDALAGRERMVVYTKKDLGRKGNGSDTDNKVRRSKELGTMADRDSREWRLICSLSVARSAASKMAPSVKSHVLRPA
jgi:ribosome biogenesis GTPase A